MMSRRSLPLYLAILAMAAMSVSVWAKNDSSDALSTSLRLTSTTSIGSTKLPAGEYKVIVDGGKAKFQQGNKVVAEIPCTLKDSSAKITETTFIMDKDQLTEIQVGGKSKLIEFSSGM